MDAGILALLTGLIGVVLGAAIIGGAMFGAYLFGKDRGRREALAEGNAPRPLSADQIARTERALETLALEVERIGETQRYTAKLLAESAAKSPPGPSQ
jgi:hypothetical protein